jgi:CBS domain-containing protein
MDSLKVSAYMRAHPVTFTAKMSLTAALEKLVASSQTGGPVIDDNHKVVGFISEQDMIQAMLKVSYYCQDTYNVADCMNSEVLTVSPEDTIIAVAEQMIDLKPKLYPVTVNDKLVGVISRRDVLRAISNAVGDCFKHPV